jgi:hypothetical protein
METDTKVPASRAAVLLDPLVGRRVLPNGTYAWTALDYNRATNVVMETLNLEPCRHEQLWCDLRLAIREVLERPPNDRIS